jgi:hypothetical protein
VAFRSCLLATCVCCQAELRVLSAGSEHHSVFPASLLPEAGELLGVLLELPLAGCVAVRSELKV